MATATVEHRQLVGERLRKLRAQLGDGKVAQAEVARRCGWDALQQWRYETGMTYPGARLIKLAAVLGVAAEKLDGKERNEIDALPLPDPDAAERASSESGEHPAVDPEKPGAAGNA